EFNSVTGWNTPANQNAQINDGQTTNISGTYTQQTSSLCVTISPQGATDAGAQWRVDGGSWQNSGVTVSGLSVGSHTVEFNSVTGWDTPANQNVQINDGQTENAGGTYTQQTGSLCVTISPQGATDAGAQWRVDSGSWQNSGATVSSLSVGNHTVEFNSVTGWDTPANQNAQINDSQTTNTSGTYTQQTGSLEVGIVPQEAANAEAQWRVDGGVWRNDEDAVNGIAIGSHTVDFKTIDGWRTPTSQTVQISKDQTTITVGIYFQPVISGYVLTSDSTAISDVNLTFSGVGSTTSTADGSYFIQIPYNWSGTVSLNKTGYIFTNRFYNNVTSDKVDQNFTGTEVGSLSVTLTPSEAIVAGAQWSVDGRATWHNSGVTISSLPVGSYMVEFKAVSGWTTPADVQVQVTHNHTTTTSGAYTQQPQSGSLTVVIYPSAAIDDGAWWRVDGGDWQISGATVDNLSEGTHTVEFNTIGNWTTPAGGQVQINSNQTTSTSGTYVQQVGSLQVTISPQEAIDASAQWSVDEGATWHNSANTITLPTGDYTLIFKLLSGWTHPANQSVDILHNQTITLSGAYSHQSGSMRVTISPQGATEAGAQWRVDSGEWQNSGTALSGLAVGTRTV
ncbi:MAG: hypothetical protein KAT56_11560, partial [Sedimentisphaerales bacterium]|nr:hypothetical protein [Sedimentisphaerales bacterium]